MTDVPGESLTDEDMTTTYAGPADTPQAAQAGLEGDGDGTDGDGTDGTDGDGTDGTDGDGTDGTDGDGTDGTDGTDGDGTDGTDGTAGGQS